jgi:hypothetical protein
MRFLIVCVLAACGSPPDDCERAYARIERITKIKSSSDMLAGCRAGKQAWDPVVQCAINSRTDQDAATCIDRGIEQSIKPGDGTAGSGINPLLP